jgi:ornithine carbamoyltransferase
MAASSFVEPGCVKPGLANTMTQHLTQDLDLSQDALVRVLELAAQVKRTPQRFAQALAGRYISLLFEKPSLRTRVTFELAIKQLGGDSVTCIGPVGEREPVKDVVRNLDRWTQAIVARVFSQETTKELAQWSHVPVINALSDLYHPCQILADMQTIKERFGKWDGLKLAFVGDGNNVAHSLMLTAGRLGMHVAVATPKGYEPKPQVVAAASAAVDKGGKISLTNDPREAVEGAQVVYTDVWASMGHESEKAARLETFPPYRVDEALMSKARPDAIFMHCLPAKRGEETTDAVMESARSVVFDQAENRLHAQKGLLLTLLG